MTRQPFETACKKIICFGVVAAWTLTACIPLVAPDPPDPFAMKWTGTSDTISPYGPLCLYFNQPVLHPDSVMFSLQPVFNDYRRIHNESADSFTLELLRPLPGATRHSLRLVLGIESVDGSFLPANVDSLVFHTWPAEQEPNNNKATADTLGSIVSGSIATANDTDWYVLRDPSVNGVYLTSTGSASLFEIRDAAGSVRRPATQTPTQSLPVPAEFVRPLYVLVYAFNRSNGGHYKLGPSVR